MCLFLQVCLYNPILYTWFWRASWGLLGLLVDTRYKAMMSFGQAITTGFCMDFFEFSTGFEQIGKSRNDHGEPWLWANHGFAMGKPRAFYVLAVHSLKNAGFSS